jgi:predicted hydrolase (HD superfamily)
MDRQKYFEAVKMQLEPNIFNHSLALEACMDGLYEYFKSQNALSPNDPPKEDWTLSGLLHDIDFSGEYKADHPKHTREVLTLHGLTISDVVYQIIQAHDARFTGVVCKNKAEWSLFCADSLTGLITAVAYVIPSRKLADVKLSSVMKRLLKEPKFAAGTRREEIKMCVNPEGLNLPVETFVEICLNAMKGIAGQIGL